MSALLPSMQKLIRQLQRIPYLASKNVYRVAGHFLESDEKSLNVLCQSILEAKQNIRFCKKCFNWSEGSDLCSICASPSRDEKIICVVETWLDLMAIDNAGGYNGVYHVLGGALCPLEGIGPSKLRIEDLVKRLDNSGVKEVILATNPTPEGEATASYISSKISRCEIPVSRLASGVPIGANLEHLDRVTISKALIGRRPF